MDDDQKQPIGDMENKDQFPTLASQLRNYLFGDSADFISAVFYALSNFSRPLAETWFKVMGWFVVIAALMTLAQITNKGVFYGLSYVSGALFIVYIMFGGMQLILDLQAQHGKAAKTKGDILLLMAIMFAGFYGFFSLAGSAGDALRELGAAHLSQ